jgi:hypothetical protein
MKKLVFIINFFIFVFMFISINIKAQELPPNNPNYQIVFHDEFDSTGLNHNKWQRCYPWGNVEYWNIWENDTINPNDDDTMYTYCIIPEYSDSLFSFDTTGNGFIRLPLKYYPNGFTAGFWNYGKIDTLDTAISILREWSYYGPHVNTTITHTYLDDDTTNNVCFSNIEVHLPYDVYQIDSIFKNNLLRVVRTCYRREFNHKTKTFNYQTPLLFSNETFRFGYFEIRTHMPYLDQNHNNQGVGPTFWIWNASSKIPHSEIDIFEIFDKSPEESYNFSEFPNIGKYKMNLTNSIHFRDSIMKANNIGLQSQHQEFGHFMFNQNNYRKVSAYWNPQQILFYKDDTLIRTSHFHPDSLIDMHIIAGNSCPITWAFDNNGHFPIMPDLDSTLLPYNYDIDYIRVYQLKLHCDSDYSTSVFNPDTFGYGLYRTITIGSGPSVISSGKDVDLMATDGITINGDFTVALGASLLLETKPCPQQEHNYNQNKSLMNMPPPDFYLHFMHE